MKGTDMSGSFTFSMLSLRPQSLAHSKKLWRSLSWLANASLALLLDPHTRKSSVMTSMPVRPSISWCILSIMVWGYFTVCEADIERYDLMIVIH